MICKKRFWYEVWITVFPITNPPEAKWWGSLDIITSIPNSRLKTCSVIPPHRIITILLIAPTLVPSPPCTFRFLSILILISLTLLDIGSNLVCLFHAAYWHDCRWCWDFRPRLNSTHPWFCGFRLCFGALHSSFCISCNDNWWIRDQTCWVWRQLWSVTIDVPTFPILWGIGMLHVEVKYERWLKCTKRQTYWRRMQCIKCPERKWEYQYPCN